MKYVFFTLAMLGLFLVACGLLDNEPLVTIAGIAGILPSFMREDFCYRATNGQKF